MSAIVQTQTIGQLTSATPPEARAFTNTDAAMVAPLVEEALVKAAELAEMAEEEVDLSGYEYMARAGDLRSLCLTLVEEVYCGFELTIDLVGGVRQGHIAILLPQRPCDVEEDAGAQPDAGARLEQSSGVVRAELNAVLCRMNVPLSDLSALGIGDVLPLERARLDRTEVLAIDRTRAAVGRLGQSGGLRAVRINEHAALPALSDIEAQDFIASRAGTPNRDADAVDVTPYPNVDRNSRSAGHRSVICGFGSDGRGNLATGGPDRPG